MKFEVVVCWDAYNDTQFLTSLIDYKVVAKFIGSWRILLVFFQEFWLLAFSVFLTNFQVGSNFPNERSSMIFADLLWIWPTWVSPCVTDSCIGPLYNCTYTDLVTYLNPTKIIKNVCI